MNAADPRLQFATATLDARADWPATGLGCIQQQPHGGRSSPTVISPIMAASGSNQIEDPRFERQLACGSTERQRPLQATVQRDARMIVRLSSSPGRNVSGGEMQKRTRRGSQIGQMAAIFESGRIRGGWRNAASPPRLRSLWSTHGLLIVRPVSFVFKRLLRRRGDRGAVVHWWSPNKAL